MTLFRTVVRLSLLTALVSVSAFSTCVENNCTFGSRPDGSQYLVCLPEDSCWNRNMVAFAHGFVDPSQPIGVPMDQLMVGGVPLPQTFNALGYGFAASSFSKNGLAILEGINDTQDLIENVVKPDHPDLNRVYVVGPSEGGLIATLSAERLPGVYNAATAACGPVGSFQAQVNYIGDFRVVFDYFFPGLIPPSPVDIPSDVMDNWLGTYVPAITAALAAHPLATAQLLNVMRAPVTSDPATIAETVLGVLSYNIFATNDANLTLGGQPFDNHNRLYIGSLNDFRLNRTVQRFTADPAARAAIAAGYETSGKLKMPEVTIHTTQDPIIPYWQETLYTGKTLLAGTLLRRTNIPIVRYGHCSFTIGEVLTAFAVMVLRDTGVHLSSSIESALPESSRSEFRELARQHGLGAR